jgi:hypothetical protein
MLSATLAAQSEELRVFVTERLLRSLPFRVLVAAGLLVLHLVAMGCLGRQRLGLPFNRAPGADPRFVVPDEPLVGPAVPSQWNRLLASRWDSQHYIALVERGYSLCEAQDLRTVPLPPLLVRCGFHFYPGYPVLGHAIQRATGLPADWALLAVSLAASFGFLLLWTGRDLVNALGLRETYLSLVLLNIFTTGFALVTVQTEPVTLFAALAAFVLLRRDHVLLGAFVAGAAGAFRVTGPAVGLAFGCALLVQAARADGPSWRRLGRLALAAPLCAWGQLAVFAYFWAKYRDPLLYVHAHAQAYGHAVSLANVVWPSPRMVLRSLSMGMHEGVFIVLGSLWLALGLRSALRKFAPEERVFWVVLVVATLAVALVGSAGLAFAGMNRYWLLAFPLFFSMAHVLRGRTLALVVWGAFSLWHYWNVDLCIYVAQHDSPRYCQLPCVR